ncbi:lytic murein transglycosylase [Profundibacter sp.]|uniref:lytic murein transglycosylase n=1 Tax=Profundibacter sp. TaxID=3101071 RepID=UPI003D0AB98E
MRNPIIPMMAVLCLTLTPAFAGSQCGGKFSSFVANLKKEAISKGHDRATVDRFFASVRQDPKTLKADRAQGVFQKDFIAFSRALISKSRLNKGISNARKYDSVFDRIQQSNARKLVMG